MSRRPSSCMPTAEPLEDIVLPAGTVTLNAATGVLTLRGTSGNDKAVVSLVGDQVQATLSGGGRVKRSFDRDQVRQIVFQGGSGRDRFVNQTAIRSTANGGGDNDFLMGGSGDDVLIGGPGNDVLIGGGGVDQLFGGPGKNRITSSPPPTPAVVTPPPVVVIPPPVPQAIDLAEGSNFVTQATFPVPLGQAAGSRTLSFDLTPQFDTTAITVIEDVFNVYLVDPANPTQTLLDRGSPRTALFSLRGDHAEFAPGLVRYDGRRVDLDVTPLANRGGGLLVFQLLNSDTDNGTRIRIGPVANVLDPGGPAALTFPLRDDAAPAGTALNLANLAPAAAVEVRIENVRFDAVANRYTADLRLRNNGPAIGRAVAVVFPNLPADVGLLNPSGTDATGAPYLSFRDAIPSGGLATGQESRPVTVTFTNPNRVRFPLTPQVLTGGPNRAPTFDAAIGPLSVMPGGRLEMPLPATDPDGDAVTFALESSNPLPGGRLQGNARLVFTPSPADVGTYTFDVVAGDGALASRQSVTLTVAADPVTTTRLSGVIQDAGGNPLAGVPVELGGVQVVTDNSGAFTLTFPGTVPDQPLTVHGEQLIGARTFPRVAVHPSLLLGRDLFPGVNNPIVRPIFLTAEDTANGVAVNPTAETVVTTPLLPAAALRVPAGGTAFTGTLRLTEVPRNRTPAALPTEMLPDLVVGIGPAGVTFTSPAQLTVPNRAGWAAGVLLDLWALDPATGKLRDAGDGRVSADGSLVQTTAGGVTATGLHFFVPRPAPAIPLAENVFNLNLGINEEAQTAEFTSEVELHSGAVLETHQLVTYQSVGQARGLTLRYDSLRADPRPIIHFGFPAVDPAALAGGNANQLRLVAQLTFRRGNFEFQVPGFSGAASSGLQGNEHFWTLPATPGPVEAALQADLSMLPSGRYDYELILGVRRIGIAGQQLVGSATRQTGQILHTNSIGSPFGHGWGLSGVQRIVENADGSALLIDGDGSELLFGAPAAAGQPYASPAGDFTTLEKVNVGATLVFRRTTRDRTVSLFDAQNRLASIIDRNNNQTRYDYDPQGRLTTVTDPVNLQTTLTYGTGFVEIRDPANRLTRLDLDAAGNLTRITDPDGSQRTFGYDPAHHLISEIDKRGFMEQTFYGFHGRAVRGVRGDGSEVRVDPVQTHGLFPPEQTSTLTGAPAAALVAMAMHADPNGAVLESRLDRFGQILSQRDSAGSLIEQFRRGGNNLPNLLRFVNNSVEVGYDAKGNPTRVTDALSGQTTLDFRYTTFDDIYTNPVGVGDFNNDVIPDFVVEYIRGTNNQSVRSVFLGNGDGTFRKANEVMALAPSNSVLVADVNQDGRLDAIFDGLFGPTLLLGDGNGVLTASRTFFGGGGASFALALGDLNNDHLPDLLVGGSSSLAPGGEPMPGAGVIDVFLGTGIGTFTQSATRISVPDRQPKPILGDADGDGDLDVLSVSSIAHPLSFMQDDDTTVSLLRNDGTGTFAAAEELAVPNVSQWLDGRDLNGDGWFDLVVFSEAVGVSVFLGTPGGTFAPRVDIALPGGAADGAIGDVNGDNRLDIIAARKLSGGAGVSRILLGDGAGGFTLGPEVSPSHPSLTETLVDLDLDGDLDYLGDDRVANDGIYLRVRLNDGTGPGSAFARMGRTATFDPVFNQPTGETDELGRQILYTVDPTNGNRLRMTQVVGAVGGADDMVTQYTYTARGLLDTETNPAGVVTDHDYDSFGRLMRTRFAVGTPDEAVVLYEYDPAGNQTVVVDENNNRTVREYDALNRLAKETSPDPDNAGPLLSSVTSYTYDQAGNRRTTTDARGNVLTEEYDARSRITKRIGADPDGAGPQTAPVTEYQYDDAGNLAREIDSLGHITQYRYDGRQRLREIIDAEGGITRYEYDATDNRTALTDPAGNRTAFRYDARNRLIRETDPRGEEIVYGYDLADNRRVKVDRTGRRTVYDYDSLNRVITETWEVTGAAPANVIHYTYDAAGNLLTVRDNFSSLTYTYDNRDRVLTVDNNGTPGVPRVILTYTYDDVGNVLTVTETVNGQAGATTAYTYDAVNRVARITQTGGGTDKRVDFTYDELNHIATVSRYADLTAANLVVRSVYTYDALNRLTDLVHTTGTTDLAFYMLRYNAAHQIEEITDRDGPRTYTYDHTHQLLTANYSNPNVPNEAFHYDANGNRMGPGIRTDRANRLVADAAFTYEYDDEGNLLRRTEIATGLVRDFRWDYRNRLVEVTDRASANGAVTQTVRYTYDALDRRIAMAVDTTGPFDGADARVTHVVYDREDVLLEFADADGTGPIPPTLAVRYLHGPGFDQVLAQEDVPNQRVRWLLPDHLGSIRDLVDNTGAVENHIIYDAFGNVLSQSNPGATTRYRFTSREFDAALGLYFYRARYYDAGTGLFLSEDPPRFGTASSAPQLSVVLTRLSSPLQQLYGAGLRQVGIRSPFEGIVPEIGDINLHRYVGNNPVNLTDPTGRIVDEDGESCADVNGDEECDESDCTFGCLCSFSSLLLMICGLGWGAVAAGKAILNSVPSYTSVSPANQQEDSRNAVKQDSQKWEDGIAGGKVHQPDQQGAAQIGGILSTSPPPPVRFAQAARFADIRAAHTDCIRERPFSLVRSPEVYRNSS